MITSLFSGLQLLLLACATTTARPIKIPPPPPPPTVSNSTNGPALRIPPAVFQGQQPAILNVSAEIRTGLDGGLQST
jgi:hypothetical protein